MDDSPIFHCSFCQRPESAVAKLLIAFPVAICADCVFACVEVLIADPRTGARTLTTVARATAAQTLLNVART